MRFWISVEASVFCFRAWQTIAELRSNLRNLEQTDSHSFCFSIETFQIVRSAFTSSQTKKPYFLNELLPKNCFPIFHFWGFHFNPESRPDYLPVHYYKLFDVISRSFWKISVSLFNFSITSILNLATEAHYAFHRIKCSTSFTSLMPVRT